MSSITMISNLDPNGSFMELLPIWVRQYAVHNDRSRFNLPKYQRGSVSVWTVGTVASTSDSTPSGSVVLTNHTFTDESFGGTAIAGIHFGSDGRLVALRDNNGDIFYGGQWWSEEPDTGIGAGYEARHLAAGKSGTYTTEAAAANDWITIGSSRAWEVTRSTNGSKNCTATFEVGLDGVESALDSAVINMTASVEI